MKNPEDDPATETFEFGGMRVTVALDAGPRILGFCRRGGPELFAALPDATIESPAGSLSLLGGHRLWRAPEVPSVTYQPDGEPVTVDRFPGGLRLIGSADRDGITKTIELHRRGDFTVVDHVLANDGDAMVRSAAWAITQLKPGGIAVLPQSNDPADADGVLPNRAIVLWPYTDPAAAEIDIGFEEIRVEGSRSRRRAKVGTANRRGWIAYALGDAVFVKWAPLHDDTLDYADLGASIQCYRDHRFLELETLSPVSDLAPAEALRHREVWRLFDLQDQALEELLASLPKEPAEGLD